MLSLTLPEFSQQTLPYTALSESQVAYLQQNFAPQIRIELIIHNKKQWRLTTAGWVGTIPLDGLLLEIRPKIPLRNLYQMLATAYDLDIHRLDDTITSDSQSLQTLWQKLAEWLADLTLLRIRRGLQRAYMPQTATLPYLRGRLRVRELSSDLTQLPVVFGAISADIPHNQLILAALQTIRRTLPLPPPLHAKIEKAYRTLQATVTPTRINPDTLNYDRLTADYQPIHALCRFFLDNSTPFHSTGDIPMLPFLFNMASLFEKFVARWLAAHLPDQFALVIQERTRLSASTIEIAIDLVLTERQSGRVLSVLDTKWKSAEKPTNADLYQIAFYANSRHSPTAALIYPKPLAQPLDSMIRDIRFKSLVFDVSAEVDHAGKRFMIELENLLRRDLTAKTQSRQEEGGDYFG